MSHLIWHMRSAIWSGIWDQPSDLAYEIYSHMGKQIYCGSYSIANYSFKEEGWKQHIDKQENMLAAIQIIIKLSKLHHCQHWLDREHVTETEFYSRYIKDNKQMSSKHQLCRGLRCETSVDQGHVFQHYFVSSDETQCQWLLWALWILATDGISRHVQNMLWSYLHVTRFLVFLPLIF